MSGYITFWSKDYVKELENEKYNLNQRIRELEEKMYINQNNLYQLSNDLNLASFITIKNE